MENRKTIRRLAVNELWTEDGNRLTPCVVELSSGWVTAYYRLERELPQTEWIGGTIRLRKDCNGRLRAYHNESLLT